VQRVSVQPQLDIGASSVRRHCTHPAPRDPDVVPFLRMQATVIHTPNDFIVSTFLVTSLTFRQPSEATPTPVVPSLATSRTLRTSSVQTRTALVGACLDPVATQTQEAASAALQVALEALPTTMPSAVEAQAPRSVQVLAAQTIQPSVKIPPPNHYSVKAEQARLEALDLQAPLAAQDLALP
jgi:hypothetical protein